MIMTKAAAAYGSGFYVSGARQKISASTLQPGVSRLSTAAAHVTTGNAHGLPQHRGSFTYYLCTRRDTALRMHRDSSTAAEAHAGGSLTWVRPRAAACPSPGCGN